MLKVRYLVRVLFSSVLVKPICIAYVSGSFLVDRKAYCIQIWERRSSLCVNFKQMKVSSLKTSIAHICQLLAITARKLGSSHTFENRSLKFNFQIN